MSWGRYMVLKSAVSLRVFLLTCPLAFLLAGVLGGAMPKASAGFGFALAGLLYLFGSIFLAHFLTEKLSKRWSH